MIHHFSVRFAFVASLLLSMNGSATADTTPVEIELTEQNRAIWRDHILPSQADLNWQQIPWLTTFQDGILSANQQERPLLFWTMNGHPLGCT